MAGSSAEGSHKAGLQVLAGPSSRLDGSREKSASELIHIVDKIQFLVIV